MRDILVSSLSTLLFAACSSMQPPNISAPDTNDGRRVELMRGESATLADGRRLRLVSFGRRHDWYRSPRESYVEFELTDTQGVRNAFEIKAEDDLVGFTTLGTADLDGIHFKLTRFNYERLVDVVVSPTAK